MADTNVVGMDNSALDQVPCELCNELICFHDYNAHVLHCQNATDDGRLPATLSNAHVPTPLRMRILDGDLGLIDLDANSILSIISNLQNLELYHHEGSDIITNPESNPHDSVDHNEHTHNNNIQYTLVTFSEPEEIDINDYEFNTLLSEVIGNISLGVPHFEKACILMNTDDVDMSDICPICQDTFGNIQNDGGNVVITKGCNHKFCEACLKIWLKNHKKCPICMLDLSEKSD